MTTYTHYPMTEVVLRQVFDPYGVAEDMRMLKRGTDVVVCVQYSSTVQAAAALKPCRVGVSMMGVVCLTLRLRPSLAELLHQLLVKLCQRAPSKRLRRRSSRFSRSLELPGVCIDIWTRRAAHINYLLKYRGS